MKLKCKVCGREGDGLFVLHLEENSMTCDECHAYPFELKTDYAERVASLKRSRLNRTQTPQVATSTQCAGYYTTDNK